MHMRPNELFSELITNMNEHESCHVDSDSHVGNLKKRAAALLATVQNLGNSRDAWREFRTQMLTLLVESESLYCEEPRSEEARKIMQTSIGKIYQAIGDVVFDPELGLRFRLVRNSPVKPTTESVIDSIAMDVIERHCMTVDSVDRVIGQIPSDDDLDAIADAVSIRSRGELLMTHSCPALSH